MALGLLRSPRLELLWSINTKASRDGSSSFSVRFLFSGRQSLFSPVSLTASHSRYGPLAVLE
jgi:hypothetical protein